MGTFFFMLLRIEAEALGYLPCGCGNLLVCQEDSKCIPMTLDWNFTTNRFYTTILDTIIIAISVVVCAIPEGLPLAVTIALSYSSEQMEALNNLVRKLTSSETMGSATHICSDKTGTLTKNEMTVMAVMALGDASATEEAENDLAKEFNAKADAVTPEGMKESLMDLIFSSIMWNSTAFIEHLTDPEKIKENRGQEYATRGNVTEQGIIKFLAKIYDFQACIQRRNDLSDDDTVAIIPFSSKRKKASIAVLNRHTNMVRVYSKGAPDMLLLTTDNIITQDGSVASLDNDHV
jgi:magnesium-transporting ATPase (P-type)